MLDVVLEVEVVVTTLVVVASVVLVSTVVLVSSVVLLVTLVVVVVGAAQVASQQLSAAVTHAVPPRGARHAVALRRMPQRERPVAVVLRHVTALERPHIERDAHRITAPRQTGGNIPLPTSVSATPATQSTYAEWLVAVTQSHCIAASWRAVSTAS